MALPLETVVKQLTDSGIIAPGKLEDFVPPKANPTSVDALVAELVKHSQLTTFQAQQVKAGKVRALILGSYTILDRIGAGGMGQVFKAQHRRMDRLVAIKMLPNAMTKDAASLARFEREVRAAAKLNHTNIVTAYDADQANGVHFLVMEYVAGKDLSVLVKKDGPFSVGKAVNYILQAARGLEFAHSEGVVHRDIKPANLLVDKKGVVKILDMGLARIEQSDGAVQAELTGTGAIMGTVDYMAPEQGLSTKHADARADIYSLGCSLHYLLVGKPTFDGETVTAKLLAHHNSPPPNLCGLRSDVPKPLQTIFAKMIAKKLEDRYQTMTEVIADLERCQSGLSSSHASATVKTSSPSASEESEMTAAFGSSRLKSIPKADVDQEAGRKGPSRRNVKLLGGAGAGGFLCLLLGVIVIFRHPKGEEVGRMELPDGTSGEVQMSERVGPPKPATAQPNQPWNTPALQAWVAATQELPADKQIEAVSKKLVELNPAFDGKMMGKEGAPQPKIDNGVVTEVGFFVNEVTDISPVRALTGLKALGMSGGAGAVGKLTDLSPLSGMQLTYFSCAVTQVADLSPLRGMPLQQLSCHVTPVADLSAVAGMPLRTMNISITPIADLSPLAGMKLTGLHCGGTEVADISVLRGMPLVQIHGLGRNVSDISPLTECPGLKLLYLHGTKVTPAGIAALQKALPQCKIEWDRPAPQANQPWNTPAFQQWVKATQALPADKQIEAVSKKLIELNSGFDGKIFGRGDWAPSGAPKVEKGVVTEIGVPANNVTDISPVRAFVGLKSLTLNSLSGGNRSALSDLSPLQGMSLTELRCRLIAKVADLSPLHGMPLGFLDIYGTQVSDLSPLRGMPLTRLDCYDVPITDLSPLQETRLTTLSCGGSKLSSLSPLKWMPLKKLEVSNSPVSDLSPLESCQSLKSLSFRRTKVTPASIAALQKALPDCKIEWDDAAKTKVLNDPGQPLSANKPWETPAFQQWIKATQALPAQQQIEAVSRKLMELNPGFDGAMRGRNAFSPPKIENRIVTELGFLVENVTDISPVRALTGLKALSMSGGGTAKGKLADLSPLDGMRLERLECCYARVANLSPVRGMPLTFLDCQGNPELSDLSPLRGMSLTELNFQGTRISGLSPLAGMKLTSAVFHYTQVSDLSPLRGMPLATLICEHTPVADLSPLEACKSLTSLKLRSTQVTAAGVATLQRILPNCKIEWDDPAKAAAAKKLAYLDPAFQQWVAETQKLPAGRQIDAVAKKLMELNPGFDGKVQPKVEEGVVTKLIFFTDNVTDISPVRALVGLKIFGCTGSGGWNGKLADLSPLEGMAITSLSCQATQVADLSPLRNMPLASLTCSNSKVNDLSTLKGVALTFLNCDNDTGVSDLGPLEGMPLATLRCGNTHVADLSPLRGMPLTDLGCTFTSVTDLSPLQDCNGLKTLDVTKTKVTLASVAVLQKALPNCKIEWGDPAQSPSPQRSSIRKEGEKQKLAYLDPAFQKWVAETQVLPAEQQLEAVSKKLMELNPGFSGKVKPKTENGVVTELDFSTEFVSDISPMRALTGLKSLTCWGVYVGLGRLTDLSPLAGMKLNTLNCARNPGLVDLTPIENLPLVALNCAQVPADLSPLAKLPLEELGCSFQPSLHTQLLQSMKTLKRINGKPVQQFWADLPGEQQLEAVVKELRARNPKVIRNDQFSGKVVGGKVMGLQIQSNLVDDLSPLGKLRDLSVLDCGGISGFWCALADLRPLAGLPLKELRVRFSDVADLSPLKGLPLEELRCDTTRVSDLAPLAGLPLKILFCHHTNVADLTPLAGISTLESLDVRKTKVTVAGVAALQKALPNCKIEWDDPAKPKTPEPAVPGK